MYCLLQLSRAVNTEWIQLMIMRHRRSWLCTVLLQLLRLDLCAACSSAKTLLCPVPDCRELSPQLLVVFCMCSIACCLCYRPGVSNVRPTGHNAARKAFLSGPREVSLFFWSSKIRQNSFSDPSGGAYDALSDPLVGWEGGHPLPIPFPLDAFGISISALGCLAPD